MKTSRVAYQTITFLLVLKLNLYFQLRQDVLRIRETTQYGFSPDMDDIMILNCTLYKATPNFLYFCRTISMLAAGSLLMLTS